MPDIIVDWFINGINMILQSILILALLGLLSQMTVLNSHISEEQAMAAEIREYNEYNEYDFTHVYSADIVSTIMRYKGDPYVEVHSGKGDCVWSLTTQTTEYTASLIENAIQTDVVYDSEVIKAPSGNVIGLVFRKHVAGCGR